MFARTNIVESLRPLRHRAKWGLTLLVVALGSALVAQACNVPVFRYALERWQPDAYRFVLFHRGALDPASQAIVADLQTRQDTQQANFIFRTVDLDALEGTPDDRAGAEALFAAQKNATLPWLSVQYPVHLRIQPPIWGGTPTKAALAELFTSPARVELARRLGAGQTAVWLLLECGDQQLDDAAANVVEDELKKLPEKLKLPELSDSPDDKLRPGVPLKIEFSVQRVSRTDPAEQVLIAMLLGSESDLLERREPLVFPVFGRGRSLFALVGPGITAENVRAEASFLSGACSCEVKELNPGFDLLLSTDWEGLFLPELGAAPQVARPARSISAEPQLVPIPKGAANASPLAESMVGPASTPADAPVEDRLKILAGLAVVAGALVMVVKNLTRRRSATV